MYTLYIIEQQLGGGLGLRRSRIRGGKVIAGELEPQASVEAARACIRLALPDATLLQPAGIEAGVLEVWG